MGQRSHNSILTWAACWKMLVFPHSDTLILQQSCSTVQYDKALHDRMSHCTACWVNVQESHNCFSKPGLLITERTLRPSHFVAEIFQPDINVAITNRFRDRRDQISTRSKKMHQRANDNFFKYLLILSSLWKAELGYLQLILHWGICQGRVRLRKPRM